MSMDPLIVKGFMGTKPNELTGFRYFTVGATGDVVLLPKNYEIFPDYHIAGYYSPVPPLTVLTNLATNPSFETTSGSTYVFRTNVCTNPRSISVYPIYSKGSTTLVTGINDHPLGITTATLSTYGVTFPGATLVANTVYTISAWVKFDGTQDPTQQADFAQLSIIAGPGQPCPNVWTRLSWTYTPTDISQPLGYRMNGTGTGKFMITGVQIEASAVLGDYIDGNIVSSIGYLYNWLGTPGASASTQSVANVRTDSPAGQALAYQFYENPRRPGSRFARFQSTTNSSIGINLIDIDQDVLFTGDVVTAIVWVRPSVDLVATLRLRQAYGIKATFNVVVDIHLAAQVWQEIRMPATALFVDDMTISFLLNGGSSGFVIGEYLDVDDHLIIKVDSVSEPYNGKYFDGSTVVTEDYISYAWTGAVDASTSTKTVGDGHG